MARVITPFLLQTRFEVDPKQGRTAFKAIEGDVDHLTAKFQKAGKEATAAFKGAEAGKKFGKEFSDSATSSIIGAIGTGGLGQTLGALIGTGMAPGLGTAIGSTIGGAIDTALGKVSAALMSTLSRGVELNKMLEQTRVEFTSFTGSAKEANAYLEDLKKLAIETGTGFGWLVETSESLYDFTGNLKLTNTLLRASVDKAADIGGGAASIRKIADALGLVAEKGDLSAQSLKALYKLKINAPQLLAEATGLSQKEIQKLMGQGRIRGDVAARLLAEGIERQSGGFAAKQAATTTFGAEQRFGVLSDVRAQEGTVNVTKGIGDYYRQANAIIGGPQAQQVVQFIDKTSGQLIGLVERGMGAGFQLTKGIAEGVMNGDAQAALKQSFGALGGFVETSLKSVFQIESPSKLTIEKVGIPIGEGIGVGTGIGMVQYAQDHADDDVRRFIDLYSKAAQKAQEETGVPASVSLAQAIIESRMGKSGLTKRANNFFGIKGSGPAGSVVMRTREVSRSGQSYYINSPFRAYNSPDESFADHARFLQGPRYRGALRDAGDPKQYARDIARAGYATDPNYARTIGSVIDKYGLARLDTTIGGAPVSTANPMPVFVVSGGSPGLPDSITPNHYLRDRPTTGGNAPMLKLGLADAAIVNINRGAEELLTTTNSLIDSSSLVLKPIQVIGLDASIAAHDVEGLMKARQDEFAATKLYQEEARKALIQAASFTDQIAGMLGQAAGQIPGQTVGKKRGFFSKLLGIAAPFLSFIPGVGPILSTIAGIASQSIGGNYGGAVSAAAGGFQPGGIFRGTGGSKAAPVIINKDGVRRAHGGPVRRGGSYWVGEHGPEPFIPSTDGYVIPNGADIYSGGRGGGGGNDAAFLALLERMHAQLSRIGGIPTDHLLRQLPDVMGRDAETTRRMGQRLRLP